MKPIKVKLNVPSGKIVFENDLRDYFPIAGDTDPEDLFLNNYFLAKQYANAGMVHFYVGNTSPCVRQYSKKKLQVAQKKTGKSLGVIYTNLWWYCAADYDELAKRLDVKKFKDNPSFIIADVEPGVYEFSYLTETFNKIRDYSETNLIFTEIKWLSPPGPIIDFRAGYEQLNFTAGQIAYREMTDWPGLYKHRGEAEKAIPEIFHSGGKINHVAFEEECTRIRRLHADFPIKALTKDELKFSTCFIARGVFLGEDISWHENGWPITCAEISLHDPDLELPQLTQAFHWDLQEDTPLWNAAGLGKKEINLNPSFQALAFNVCYSALEYGVLQPSKFDKRIVGDNVKVRERFNRVLLGLSERYPDSIPSFCRGLIEREKKNGS